MAVEVFASRAMLRCSWLKGGANWPVKSSEKALERAGAVVEVTG